jgi:GntR family transcriptional regulator of gluconate operon
VSNVNLSPLRVLTLADHTSDALRALIASGDLRGGQRLIETEIATQLGVSRGPVRDAFKQLREEGLLVDFPRRGTYVVSLTSDDARDLLDLRAGLEARAARLFIERGDPEAFRDVDAAAAVLADATRSGDPGATSDADYGFHEAVCRGSGSRRLLAVFIRHATEMRVLLQSDTERLYQIGVDLATQHNELRDLLRAGDPTVAEAAFRSHVEETRDRMVEILASQADH